MEAKIIQQEKNPFLSREEILIEMKSEATPSFEEIKNEIGKDDALVVVKKVNSNFGTQVFTAEVFVYDSIEAKKKIETIPKKIRKKMAEEEKANAEKEKAAQKEAEAAEVTPEKEAPTTESPTETLAPAEISIEETKSEPEAEASEQDEKSE